MGTLSFLLLILTLIIGVRSPENAVRACVRTCVCVRVLLLLLLFMSLALSLLSEVPYTLMFRVRSFPFVEKVLVNVAK